MGMHNGAFQVPPTPEQLDLEDQMYYQDVTGRDTLRHLGDAVVGQLDLYDLPPAELWKGHDTRDQAFVVLFHSCRFEESLRITNWEIPRAMKLSQPDRRHFQEHVASWRSALPSDPAEMSLVSRTMHGAENYGLQNMLPEPRGPDRDYDVPRVTAIPDTVLVTNGLVRHTNGERIVATWTDWHFQRARYARSPARRVARLALEGMRDILTTQSGNADRRYQLPVEDISNHARLTPPPDK